MTMNPARIFRFGLPLFLIAVSSTASANNWLVCDYTARTLSSNALLHATLVTAARKNPSACPQSGSELDFIPQTPDYQRQLPKRKWPKVGQEFRLRYRELHGYCKNDGHEAPCTIKHYSVL